MSDKLKKLSESNASAKHTRVEVQSSSTEVHSDFDASSNLNNLFEEKLCVSKKLTEAEKIKHKNNLWTPGKIINIFLYLLWRKDFIYCILCT